MNLQRPNSGDATNTVNRSRDIVPCSGLCSICTDGCKGNCEVFKASFRGREVIYPGPFGEIHYHYWSPCIKPNVGFWDNKNAPPLCKDETNCLSDTSTVVATGSVNSQTSAYDDKCHNGGLLGLARDGHIIVGPWNKDGHHWSCDEHDVCNGAFVDGQYVYVATTTFPYVVGCWGPAD